MIDRRLLLPALTAAACLIGEGAVRADQYDPPANYYSNATGTGATLKSQLFTITSTGMIKRSYGDARYAYGTGSLANGSPGGLIEMDLVNTGSMVLAYNRGTNNGQWDSGATWNREHIWPKSWLNLTSSQVDNGYSGVASDLFELRPASMTINSTRGNLGYGGSTANGQWGVVGSYFYPGAADTGDMARALFYMATRYGQGQTNNITLVNGAPTALYTMGDLASLLKWNYTDPVDQFERKRNQYIYSSTLNPNYYQNNRNPYIDHPEWVWSVFGGGNNDSQISVATPSATGASSLNLNIRAMVGAAPGSAAVFFNKAGANPTTFNVHALGNATSTLVGDRQGFDYGPRSKAMTVSLNGSTAVAGPLASGSITIDNTDITTGGAGLGSADGDDVINVTGAVVNNRTITASPVVFGSVIVGYSGSLSTTLSTSGDDDHFTRVTLKGTAIAADANGVSVPSASDVVFNTDGQNATRSLTAQFDTPGRKFGAIQLVRQGEGLAGESVNPITVNYGAIVRPHSEASFSDQQDLNAITLDLGTLVPGDAPINERFGLFNIAGPGAAGLSLTDITGSGDLSALTTDLSDFGKIIGGGEGIFTATLNPTLAPGEFSAIYQLHLSDEKLPGATGGQVLTLNLTGTVVPEPIIDRAIDSSCVLKAPAHKTVPLKWHSR